MSTTSAHKTYSVPAREAAEQLGVHVETVKRWLREGKVPARKNFAGQWLLAQEDVDNIPISEVVD